MGRLTIEEAMEKVEKMQNDMDEGYRIALAYNAPKDPNYELDIEALYMVVAELRHYKDLEEQGRLINEEDVLKFYYIDSEDKYVVGRRLDTMYYAEVTERFSLAFYMSRYLPWGEHVVDENSAWKECTYCSEPREIPFTEWLKGFMEQRAKLKELENE